MSKFKPRKLTKEERNIINRFKRLDRNWPESLVVYADNDILRICDSITGQVFGTFNDIFIDFGTPSGPVVDGVPFVYEDYDEGY